MRWPLLLRSLVLAGAAFSMVVVGSAACATVAGGDPATVGIRATITQVPVSDDATAPAALSAAQQVGRLTNRDGSQSGQPATAQPAGPSVFEQQARQGQPAKQIAAGPSTFEQQLRSQVPSPPPTQITRGPGPHFP